MSGEVVKYVPTEQEGLPRRRTKQERDEARLADPTYACCSPVPSLVLGGEARERLDAFLAAAGDGDPARAAFTDLMTASLEAVLIQQGLRVLREVKERFTFRRSC